MLKLNWLQRCSNELFENYSSGDRGDKMTISTAFGLKAKDEGKAGMVWTNSAQQEDNVSHIILNFQ